MSFNVCKLYLNKVDWKINSHFEQGGAQTLNPLNLRTEVGTDYRKDAEIKNVLHRVPHKIA